MEFKLKKYGKLLVMNNYSLIIEKITGVSFVHVKEEGNKIVPCLSVFFDGNKIDFKNENEKFLNNLYVKLIEILSGIS